MSFLKDIGNKAKGAASAIGEKSQDMVEVGKIKMKVSNLEGDIKKIKAQIGEVAYEAHAKAEEFPIEAIEKLFADIDEKTGEIEALKIESENV